MKVIGFPRMHKEANEMRDFLPVFFEKIKDYPAKIFLETGYGEALGFTEQDYLDKNPNISFVSNKECYSKEMVVVLRCPEWHELDYLQEGSTLVSMLHYPTRKKRVAYLKRRNIFGVSMDAIRNDLMERLVVDYKGTSGNGINAAFSALDNNIKDLDLPSRPLNVSIMGMGMVGLMAAKSAVKYGSLKNEELFKAHGFQPVMVNMLSRSITSNRDTMEQILSNTDILVDASNREDATKYIIDNSLLASLPEHAVILDLSADPYLEDLEQIQVKAIEGIPTGTLDKYIFYPQDKEYLEIPKSVNTLNRRTVVSCNAWPGVNPKSCMKLYGTQMMPIVKLLINMEPSEFCDNHDNFFVRAIYRSTLAFFEKTL